MRAGREVHWIRFRSVANRLRSRCDERRKHGVLWIVLQYLRWIQEIEKSMSSNLIVQLPTASKILTRIALASKTVSCFESVSQLLRFAF